MSRLSYAARQEIRWSGLTLAAYARSIGWSNNEAGRWYGDSCGCSDDRCIGHHHDANEECGCLPVLISRALESGALRR